MKKPIAEVLFYLLKFIEKIREGKKLPEVRIIENLIQNTFAFLSHSTDNVYGLPFILKILQEYVEHLSMKMDSSQQEETIRAETSENHNKNTLFLFRSAHHIFQERKRFFRIHSGSESLNRVLGGGIEQGAITEFFGEYRTGKTQICLKLAVMATLPENLGGNDGKTVYIDTEGSFRPERIVQICEGHDIDHREVLDRIFVGKAPNTKKQMQLIEEIARVDDSEIILVIVDSLTANFRAEFMGKDHLFERQQLLNKHISQLNQLAAFAEGKPKAVVVTNQVIADFSNLFGETHPIAVGGNIVAHGTTHRISLQRVKDRTIARLVDSPYLPETEGSFRITFNGIEDCGDSEPDSFDDLVQKLKERE